MKHYFLKYLLAANLFFPLVAQNNPAGINLLVVEGEGVATGARQRVSREPAVKVEDEDHRPVSGAAVIFALPVSGASGEFLNGTKSLSVTTDQEGLAVARGLKTNDITGKLQIYVTASYRGLRARTLINQFIEPAPGVKTRTQDVRSSKSGGAWKWVVLGIIAAGGAGAGVYYGTHSNGSSPTASGTTSISAGTVVFGSPR